MAFLEETDFERDTQPTLVDRLPDGKVGFMGQAVINLADLKYRNSQVEEACLESTTEVRFSTHEPVLTIGDSSKRFSSSVARLLGSMVDLGVELRPNSELRDEIAKAYGLTINSAGYILSEASQTLKYWRFDSKGALIVVERGYTGLREDLTFLPQENVFHIDNPKSSLKIPKKTSPEPMPPLVKKPYEIKIRTIKPTGQQYISWWPDHILNSEGLSASDDQEPETSSLHTSDHPQFDFENTPEQEDITGSLEVDDAEKTTDNESIRVFRTTDVFTQAAMTAAFDYFFKGGEMPLATDAVTYNAFQKAIQETGGSDSTEMSGPVIKLYFGEDEIRMTSAIRQRIIALGESIHGERPREVSLRSATPSLTFSTASKDWMQEGACQGLDPNIFYPDKDADDDSPDVRAAKAICSMCVVQVECLEYALKTNQGDGIWGGLTGRNRRALK